MFRAKKLALVSAIYIPVIVANKEADIALERVLCINYPLSFQKNTADVRGLINSGRKINAMTPTFAAKLGFKVCSTDIKAQKIDGSSLKIFDIALASF